jgi:hypothetical protein
MRSASAPLPSAQCGDRNSEGVCELAFAHPERPADSRDIAWINVAGIDYSRVLEPELAQSSSSSSDHRSIRASLGRFRSPLTITRPRPQRQPERPPFLSLGIAKGDDPAPIRAIRIDHHVLATVDHADRFHPSLAPVTRIISLDNRPVEQPARQRERQATLALVPG